MDVYIDQDNIGPGDLYTMNGAGDRYTLTGWSVQYSTTGRVFVMNNASQSVYIWDGVASSQGSATIYASSDAADAIVNVRGTVRNTAANGVALSLNGSSAHVFVSETGLIYASEADAVGILLTSSDLTGVAVINNEGRILGNDAIVRTGAQNVEIVNDGSIYGQSSAYVDRYGGVDAITNNGAMGAINLGGGADSYFGQHGRNSGGVYGGAGNDLLFGGRDEDYLYGGYDDDRLFGGAGRDRLFGHAGNDQISGGDGADRLVGGAGDDRLNGGAGVDSLIGDAGNDWLNGGAGRDLMVGRDGDDTYWVDNVRDIVSESVGQGRDRVFSSVTFS
ncbi:calcium-binding protein, partial [Salmonella enterica subsp. enterica]|nr:calcium-binding protein [Salmonella enterica subsp. enterica]